MKRQIKNYTFVKGGAGVGTVTFTDLGTVRLDQILLVENVTRGITIYNPFDPAKLGTVATNVLTLAFDTSAQNNADKLFIVYDDDDLDYDSGAGTAPRHAQGLVVAASGGPVAVTGDAANGLDVDVTRSALPTGAATSTLQGAGLPAALGAGGGLKVDGSGTALPVSGPLTDTQLRATAVPVSGTVTASGPLTDTQLRATAVPVSGTVTTSNPNAYTEDAVAPGDPVGTSQVVVQVSSPSDRGATAGDWVAKAGTKYGASLVQLVTSAGAFIDSTGGTQFAEDVAHTTGDVGTMVLAKRTDVPAVSSGTDGDYSTVNVDADGKLWVNSGTVRARKLLTPTTITASTGETTIIAAVASEAHDLYGLTLTNTGTTATKVSIRDDTAGTVKMVLYVPAGATVGFTLPVDSAIPQTAQNKNWTATCNASTSSMEVTALYIKVT